MSAALTKKDAPAPYQQSVDALLALLCTDAKRGLSANEARTRLQRDGRNELTVEEPAPGWKKFLAQFKGVLVILLVIATLISFALWLVERETPLPYEAIAIFNFNEWATPEGPVEREMIERGALTKEEVQDFTKDNIVWRDQVWTKAACYLIREHKPNLVLFHLLTLDSTHHRYGPKATAAMAFLDSCVSDVVEAVKDAGMTERTTFLVVSDHGFKAYTNEIHTTVALQNAGLGKAAYVLPEGGTGFLYLTRTNSAEVSAKVIDLIKSVEGVADVILPNRFASLGSPQPGDDPQMFDVLLAAKQGYSFSGATGGAVTAAVPQQAGSHGYLASDPDLDAIFIASGYGIVSGKSWNAHAQSMSRQRSPSFSA